MKKVIVIGGGLAGMSAAYYLLKNGRGRYDVTLLESEKHLGGRVLTKKVSGVDVDMGGFMIFPFYRKFKSLVKDLGLKKLLRPIKSNREYYKLKNRGSLVADEKISLLKFFPPSLKLRRTKSDFCFFPCQAWSFGIFNPISLAVYLKYKLFCQPIIFLLT